MRIALCLSNSRDREHIRAWLSDSADVTASDCSVPTDSGFDLCILDAPCLDANRNRIAQAREAEQPVFLPFLLVARKRQIKRNRTQLLADVDDVIWAPIARVELDARVGALLRIRNLARLVQQRYVSLANQSGAAVLVVGDGRIRHANEAARRAFAVLGSREIPLEPGVAPGLPYLEDLIAPDYRRVFLDYLERVAARARGEESADHRPEPSHVEVRANTEQERWVHVSAAPTFEDDDREFLVMMFDVTEAKLRERELRESRQRIQSLAGQLVRVEQRERSRLAGDIHDGVNQSLASLRMRLDLIRKAPEKLDATEELADIRRILDQAITQTRSLIVELDPPTIREAGLAATLSWLAEQFRDTHGLEVSFAGNTETVELSNELQHVIYRAARELLFNVLKHAPGADATIEFEESTEDVRVTVSDNGPGFDPQTTQPGSGFGLFSLRERLKPFDGTVEIDSAPGDGSRIVLKVPKPSEEEYTYAQAHTAR